MTNKQNIQDQDVQVLRLFSEHPMHITSVWRCNQETLVAAGVLSRDHLEEICCKLVLAGSMIRTARKTYARQGSNAERRYRQTARSWNW